MAIVKAAAAIAAIGNPEHTLDGAHRTANAGADRTADHSTHRTGRPVAFIGPLLRSAHDTLGMPDMGRGEQGDSECRTRKMQLGGRTW